MVVTATYKYDSEAGRRNRGRKTSSALARDTFHALKNFVNTEQCGVWYCGGFREKPHPIYLISQEKWDLLARRASHYADGRKFEFWHVTNDILGPKHVQRMLDGTKHYYTGGLFGLAMFMVDGDANRPSRQVRRLARGFVLTEKNVEKLTAYLRKRWPERIGGGAGGAGRGAPLN